MAGDGIDQDERSEACIALVRRGRPPTSNRNRGARGEAFTDDLRTLYRESGGGRMEGELYGRSYYFVRRYDRHKDADAGAASKQVWDGLEGVAYDDDRVVVLRISLRFDLGVRDGFASIDLTDVPDPAFDDLLQALEDDEEHFLYVELGPYADAMVEFGARTPKGATA